MTRMSDTPISASREHHRTIIVLMALICVSSLSGCVSLRRDTGSEDIITARQMSLRGFDSLRKGKLEDAEAWFANSIETNPVDDEAHEQYAELLWQRNLRSDAIDHLEKAVKLSGGNGRLVVRLGEMYLAEGDDERAWRQAETAIQSNRQLPCAWALRGDVRHHQGKLNEALADYHRSLSFEGHCPHVQLALASIYRQQNRPRRALSTLDSLAENYPPNDMPQGLLLEQGLALKALGRHENAVTVLAQASRRGEPSAELLFHLAEAQLLAGDPTNARLALVAALAQEPTHVASSRLQQELDQQQATRTAALRY